MKGEKLPVELDFSGLRSEGNPTKPCRSKKVTGDGREREGVGEWSINCIDFESSSFREIGGEEESGDLEILNVDTSLAHKFCRRH